MTDPILATTLTFVKVYGARGAGRATGSVAVDDVSFDVARGSSLGIVGEFGLGEDHDGTHHRAALETANAGTLTVDGKNDRSGTPRSPVPPPHRR